MRQPQREPCVLLDQQNGGTRFVQALDDAHDVGNELRRQPHGGFVEQHHAGAVHQGTPHRQHLLLTAGEQRTVLMATLVQDREQLIDFLEPLSPQRVVLDREGTQFQVLLDRQPAQDTPAFRHVNHAATGDLVSGQRGDRFPFQMDIAAPGPHQSRYGLERGRLAGPVAAQQGHDFPFMDIQRYPTQRLDLAVEGFDIADAQPYLARPRDAFRPIVIGLIEGFRHSASSSSSWPR